jgi:hypothetical protein
MVGPSSAHAAEISPEFKWSDPIPARVNEMAAIQNRIDQRAAKILELGTTSTRSPKGTQELAIKELSALNRPDSPDMIRLQQLRDAAAADRDVSFKGWQDEQNRLRDEILAKKKAETSLFDVIPGTRAAMTALSPVASYFGGKYLGRRLSPYAAVPVGATTGALEGAASIGLPTEVDINSLPESSPARQQAQANLSDPDYYKRLALAATVSGAFGGLGATRGYASTRPVRIPPLPKPPPEPAGLPSAGTAAETITPPRPKAPPQIHHLPDGTQLKQYGPNRWQFVDADGNHRWMKAVDAQAMRSGSSMPSSAVHAPPSQASGGGIRSPAMNIAYGIRRANRAEGGAVHAGPIMSNVPGRTDNHPMDVAEGSYVIPSETVSHLGENNTNAGMEVLNSMFGPESEIGGGASAGETNPVPINAAGGEFVIAPEVVATIGGGDIKRGHEILDQWIMGKRKQHISTLRKLPGPAKS